MKAPFHIAELKERKVIESMKRIPAPTRAHIEALDKMVLDIVEKYGMVESEREVAVEVSEEVGTFVSENFPGCSLMLYGSVASRLALKESNIDMNLRAPPNLNGPTTLGAISKLISENPLFSNVAKDFDEGRPSIHFVHKRTNVKCSVCLCKDETIKTTEIISKYQTIDPRVRQLAVVFRKWAKVRTDTEKYDNILAFMSECVSMSIVYYILVLVS
ncbi:hypothetical protein J437_LFUL014634 [Ladona fulva]|uniref:Terminal uridylyltransferase 4/7 nucleotidyltransferase domain-containing protein n=1 Tax=Ladona fulva TaxID=123851 RepID=A0A8K0KH91_LADFU|nr:hypothetical protein J437_LFUL014634 [Ladona fulva]